MRDDPFSRPRRQRPALATIARHAAIAFFYGLFLCTVASPQDGPASTETTPQPSAKTTAQRVARPAGAPADRVTVIPETFLRRWDPITLFFPADQGPAGRRPRGRPRARRDSLAPRTPAPGAGSTRARCSSSPPIPGRRSSASRCAAGGPELPARHAARRARREPPAAGASGLEPVEEIALTFADPLPAEALARALVVEVRPLAIGEERSAGGRFLGREDFEVKTVERASAAEAATYVLVLRQPIPTGQRVTVRLRLTLDDPVERAFWRDPVRDRRAVPRAALRLPRAAAAGGRRGARATRASRRSPARTATPRSWSTSRPIRATLGVVEARNLVRVSPAVARPRGRASPGRRLELRGDFQRETPYRVTLVPTPLSDASGRPLDLSAANERGALLPARRCLPAARRGVGPGRAQRAADACRSSAAATNGSICASVAIDALDRSFWPFPDQPVEVDESARPPGPGEEPAPWPPAAAGPDAREIGRRILALGSPPVSALVDLPLRRDGGSAAFGLDLGAQLDRIAGTAGAGHLPGRHPPARGGDGAPVAPPAGRPTSRSPRSKSRARRCSS